MYNRTMNFKPEIIVVGGGHAGVEAALVAARMAIPTLLITAKADALGQMPCNPSIGGLAKSHLVFELDALGGEMGFNTDLTSLQEKTLNTSRGPAVRATRAQCDKKQYARRLCRVAALQPNLEVLEDSVVDLILDATSKKAVGVRTLVHGEITGKAIIMGRKTLESFPNGQPLKNRTNIVITRKKDYKCKDVIVVHSVEEALEAVKDVKSEDIYVIGGGEIYKQMLPYCDLAHVTKIDYAYQADTYFPNLDELEDWEMTGVSEEQTYYDLVYEFCRYERKK